jgi:hypothetical protein
MYYGLDWARGVNVQLGGGYVPYVMVSAGVLWNSTNRRFQEAHPPRHDSLFLDSGGFSLARENSEYPFSRTDYARVADRCQADLVATRDLPCEPQVDRTAHATNRDRIAWSVTEATTQFRERPDLPWVPVIQGYVVGEYLECVDLLESAKLVRPFMAIGSLCARRRVDRAWSVIQAVRRRLPDVRLHGFGIDLRFVRDRRIRAALWSADTAAWKFIHDDPARRFPSNAEKPGAFAAYRDKVDLILKLPSRSLGAWE